ncbi:MAG: ribosomal-processing cysteine protease Prp [Clostridia bacterium]|nr:ribosomal-processing cysteine protease Prp [Clostridia bacterium]
MIRAAFFREGERLTGFECEGHAGYAESGSDIVCAGVSALLTACANAIEALVGAAPEIRTNEEIGYLKLTLPRGITPRQSEDASLLLKAARLGLEDINRQYPDNVRVITKDRRSCT